jgi:hypothetical protein
MSRPSTGRAEWKVWALLGLAVLVQVTVRDRWVWSGICFYLTPWPVLSLGAFLAWCRFRRWRWLACSLVLSGMAVILGVGPGAGPVPEKALHLRVWNAGNPTRGHAGRTAAMRKGTPDLMVLTDSGDYADWLRQNPDVAGEYEVLLPGGGFTVWARPSLSIRFDRWVEAPGRHTRMAWLHTAYGSLLLVELDYRPFKSKAVPVEQLLRESRERPGPVILAGDFNLPRNSVWAGKMKASGFPDAFSLAGEGWQGSWPSWMPVHGLVQVRGSAGSVRFHRAEHGDALGSDHRALDVWLTVREGAPDR